MEPVKTFWKSGLNSPGWADDQLAGHYEHNSPLGSIKSRKSLNQVTINMLQTQFNVVMWYFQWNLINKKTALHIHNPYIILLIYYQFITNIYAGIYSVLLLTYRPNTNMSTVLWNLPIKCILGEQSYPWCMFCSNGKETWFPCKDS